LEQQFWIAEDYDENKGDIQHLIILAELIAVEQGTVMDAELFKSVFACYLEIWESESAWCELIDSDMYSSSHNRVYVVNNWHKHKSLMALVHDRWMNQEIKLEELLTQKRKEFVIQYNSVKKLKEETDSKKQLYIYMILTEEVEGRVWEWDNKWNFGIHENIEGCNSLFDNGGIYERYGSQWRYNSGYKNGLWIQKDTEYSSMFLKKLINWSKK